MATGGEERRVVTVLFADLVNSTRLVESLDPEAARGLLDDLFQRLAAEVHHCGGTLEKYVGDAILAVFGFPSAHGDDAARAVRAALAMRDVARALAAEAADFQPCLRIGLDTGEVVVRVWASDLRVAGDAVFTAARIQQAAEPDQILISARTLRAVREPVHTGQPHQIVARGKLHPVEVVEVLGLEQTLEPAGTVLVDREQDLPRLVRALEEAMRQRRLVLLVGEAGIGKTTLARAATGLFDGARVLWGRCLPEWQSLPLWPVREVLAAAAGVPATETAAVLAGAIGRLVAEAWPEPETAVAAAAAVCRLIGLDPDERGGQPSRIGARELAATLAGVLGRLASRQPTLVVLEDIHCATRDLLDVAAILISTSIGPAGQLGFLGISRPEAPALDPEWTTRAGTERIDLGSLPATATSQLLAATLGEERVAPGLAGRVFEASRGNPLFVKEMALALQDSGALGERPSSLPIPDSLWGLVGARLDRLPALRKQVLCRAAVIGRWFSPAALAGMTGEAGEGLEQDLDALAQAGLIERLPARLTGRQDSFAFHHALFREVAYSLLPKASRSALHERLATWLAVHRAPAPGPPEAVASHLVQAVRLAREIRSPSAADRALASRAVATCRQAAQRLREQEALMAAAALLDDAFAMAEIARTPPEDVAELRVMRGTLRAVTGDPEGALQDLEAATGSERAAIRAQAYVELSNLHGVLSDYGPAAPLAELALAEARAASSPSLVARALRARALGPYLAGNLVETVRLLEEALALSRADDQPGLTIDLQSTLLNVRLYLATPLDELTRQARELAAAARAHGRRNAEAAANFVLGEVHALRGDLDGAERHLSTADRQWRDIGLTSQLVWSLLRLARVAIGRGDPVAARRFAQQAIAVNSRPDGVAEPEAFLALAEACLADDDHAGASAATQRARSSLQPGDVVSHAYLLRAEGHLATARGEHEAAAELLERSLAALDDTDYRLDRLRIVVDLVPALARVGRRAHATALASEALGQTRAIGAHAFARELEGAR
jgi:class 3 adenylate cyclase/tetratricopeptide (TPR) repeat protein